MSRPCLRSKAPATAPPVRNEAFSHCILLIPHQKGGKGKKGKKGDDGEDGVALTPEEREARAKLRIEALERELVLRQDTVNRALQAHNDVRQRQSELLKDFEVNTPRLLIRLLHPCPSGVVQIGNVHISEGRKSTIAAQSWKQQSDMEVGLAGREADYVCHHGRHDTPVQEHARRTHAAH